MSRRTDGRLGEIQARGPYDLACDAPLSGAGDGALEHPARAIEPSPSFREAAHGDSGLGPVREDPRFLEAVAEP